MLCTLFGIAVPRVGKQANIIIITKEVKGALQALSKPLAH